MLKQLLKIVIIFPAFMSVLLIHDFVWPISGSYIGDYIVGSPYKIIKVNNKEETRVKSGFFVTKKPIVSIPKGEHTITIVEAYEDNSVPIDLSVSIKLNTKYSLIKKEGKPTLIIVK
jgi:hypothetical protein